MGANHVYNCFLVLHVHTWPRHHGIRQYKEYIVTRRKVAQRGSMEIQHQPAWFQKRWQHLRKKQCVQHMAWYVRFKVIDCVHKLGSWRDVLWQCNDKWWYFLTVLNDISFWHGNIFHNITNTPLLTCEAEVCGVVQMLNPDLSLAVLQTSLTHYLLIVTLWRHKVT